MCSLGRPQRTVYSLSLGWTQQHYMHNAIFLTNYSLLYSPAAALLSRLIIANVTPHHHHPLRCTLYSSRRLVVIDVR